MAVKGVRCLDAKAKLCLILLCIELVRRGFHMALHVSLQAPPGEFTAAVSGVSQCSANPVNRYATMLEIANIFCS